MSISIDRTILSAYDCRLLLRAGFTDCKQYITWSCVYTSIDKKLSDTTWSREIFYKNEPLIIVDMHVSRYAMCVFINYILFVQLINNNKKLANDMQVTENHDQLRTVNTKISNNTESDTEIDGADDLSDVSDESSDNAAKIMKQFHKCLCGAVVKKTLLQRHYKTKLHLSSVYHCVCGSIILKSSKVKHWKTAKHLTYLEFQ